MCVYVYVLININIILIMIKNIINYIIIQLINLNTGYSR